MKILTDCMRGIDWLNEKVGLLVSWLTTALVLMVCTNVLLRYVFNSPQRGTEELAWHFFSAIILLGAAYTLKHDKHVRVDLLYMKFSKKTRAWINLLGSLLFLAPFSIVVIWASLDYVGYSFQDGEVSPEVGGLPYRFIIKSIIPVAFGLLTLQAVSLAIRSLLIITGRDPDPEQASLFGC